jgi:hypothetical protein
MNRLLLAALVTATVARPCAAQRWALDVHGGRIRSSLDPSGDATQSVVAGIGFDDAVSAFRVSTGIPTESGAPVWGALGGFKRVAAHSRGFTSGIDLSGDGFVFRESSTNTKLGGGLLGSVPRTTQSTATGHALSASALPLVAFDHGPFSIQARAGVSWYSGAINGQSAARTLGLGELQLTWHPDAGVALAPVIRRFAAASEPASTFAGISGVLASGPGTLSASVGRWSGAPDTASAARAMWGLGGSLRVSGRATLDARVRHDAFDPLSLAPPQTSWSVGLSFALSAPRKASRAPVPAAYHDGQATIRVPVASVTAAGVPRVAGDFNSWNPAPMQRTGDEWSYTVRVPPGVYNYSFVTAQGTWFVPENVPGRKDDGMGGQVAVLVVR